MSHQLFVNGIHPWHDGVHRGTEKTRGVIFPSSSLSLIAEGGRIYPIVHASSDCKAPGLTIATPVAFSDVGYTRSLMAIRSSR